MHAKPFANLILVTALTAAGAVHADRDEHHSRDRRPFEFALIGDTPYLAGSDPSAAYPPFDRLVDAINRERKLQWVLHAGDIKNGSTECSDALFQDRLRRFSAFTRPLIYSPGDNEWTDCHRLNNGQYQPLERLAKLREVLFAEPGTTLGGRSMRVDSQALLPGHEEFPENVRWTHNGVLFATLHIVGSHNGQDPFQPGSAAVRSRADDDEVARRNAANIAWLTATFDQAERTDAPGVLFVIQANPGLEFDQSVSDRAGYEEFLAALEARTAAFGKPVVLAHGDSHYFRIDKPRLLNHAFLSNLTRVETFGAGNVHWVRVRVDPRSHDVFRFEPEIIQENR